MRELRAWRDAFAGKTMRALDPGWFQWHGYLALILLTTDEPGVPAEATTFSAIAQWRLYNFGVRCERWLRTAREELGLWMHSYWSAVEGRRETSEQLFGSAIGAVLSAGVAEELLVFRKFPDFQITALDPDHPNRGDLAVVGCAA